MFVMAIKVGYRLL